MGLLGGIARVAVASGTATAVSNRVSRRQANRWSEQSGGTGYVPPSRAGYYPQQQGEPEPAQAAPAAAAPDTITQLKELAQLKDQGVLTEQEFADQKAKVLAG